MEKLQECYVHFKSAKVQLDYHRKRSVLMKKTVEDLYERLERVRSVATITVISLKNFYCKCVFSNYYVSLFSKKWRH